PIFIARFVEDVVYTRQKMSAVALYSDECDTVVVSVGYSPEDYVDAADEMLSQLCAAPSARSAHPWLHAWWVRRLVHRSHALSSSHISACARTVQRTRAP